MKALPARLIRAALSAVVCVVTTGCTHTVKYKLTDKDKWQGAKVAKTLRVDTFTETNAVYTEREIKLEGKVCRTNYRKGYSEPQIATAVSDMIAQHLAYSGIFNNVVRNKSDAAEWVLSGNIKEYRAAASVNSVAEGVQAGTAGLGLIGALVGTASTAGMKSSVSVNVELSPVTLTDQAGKVIWQTTVGASTNFVAHFSAANQRAVFHHTDELLKQTVSGLIQSLAKADFDNQGTAANR